MSAEPNPDPDPHWAVIDPATGRIESVSGPALACLPEAERARLNMQPIPHHCAADFHADPRDRSWINGQMGRCDPLRLRLITEARSLRQAKLLSSDYIMGSDAPVDPAKVAAWRVYRQALRDITKQPGYPTTIAWPTPPAK